MQTASSANARTVRLQMTTPPGALSREGQLQVVKKMTDIVAATTGDPTQAAHTWIILSEAAEGGWGVLSNAFGKDEFVALAAKSRAAG